MTKSERLLHLIELLRRNQPMSLSELCAACRVSQRTMYRDIQSLSRLNVPVYFKDGYCLRDGTGAIKDELSADDIELIFFSMRNCLLAEYPYFDKKFKAIEQVFQSQLPKTAADSSRLFIGKRNCIEAGNHRHSDVLDRFFQAVRYQRMISFRSDADGTRNRSSRSGDGAEMEGLFIPMAVRVREDGIYLLISRDKDSKPIEIALTAVRELTLA
ncbi:MAG: HTH domain-containing protein, partial [candidate division Zixibacteria bacterium]